MMGTHNITMNPRDHPTHHTASSFSSSHREKIIPHDDIDTSCNYNSTPGDNSTTHHQHSIGYGCRKHRLQRSSHTLPSSHIFLLCTLLLLNFFPYAFAETPHPRLLQEGDTGSYIDTKSCYANLNASDLNSDGILSQSEFLVFVQSSANGTLETNQYGMPITEFSLLPSELISVYNLFACGNAIFGCPSLPGIVIGGISNEGETTSFQQGIVLFQLCTKTEQTIRDVTGSVQPTSSTSPSVAPTASNNATTFSPTASQNSSLIPTSSPSAAATIETNEPTYSTSILPAPTVSPTLPDTPSLLPTTTTLTSATSVPTLNATILVPTLSPTTSPVTPSLLPTTRTPTSTTPLPTLNDTMPAPTISPTTSPVAPSLLPTTTTPTSTTPPPTTNATIPVLTISPTTSPVRLTILPTTMTPTTTKPFSSTPPPTEIATTRAPTPSPSTPYRTPSPTTPFPTPIPRCPPLYNAGATYEAGDKVANYGEDNIYSYYQCKPYPMSGWCSQSAYEPGDSLNWEESWTLLGQCLEDEPILTSVPSSEIIVTSSPTLAPSPTPTSTPSLEPTALDENDPPYSGHLNITFQYEIYNTANADAQSILTGEDPVNNIMDVLEQSTEDFVEDVVATTFGSDGTKTGNRRKLASVTLEPNSVIIANVDDIPCPDSTLTFPCQNITALARLTLVDEPVLSTTEECETAIENALIDPGLSFPTSSGVFYYIDPSTSSTDDAISPIELPDSTSPTISPAEKQSGTPSWVVPVSICVAIIGATLLLFLVGKEVRKRKRSRIEYGGSARKEPDEEEVYRDIMGSSNKEGSSNSYPEILISPDKDISPLDADVDLEMGKRSGVKQSKNNPFLEGSDSSSSNSRSSISSDGSSESFTSGSSSSGSSSHNSDDRYPDSSELWAKKEHDDANLTQAQPQETQPMVHFMSLNTLNEEGTLSSSEQSLLSNSNSDGKLVDNSAFRGKVEALVREACPEKIEKIDDLIVEYEGREQLLIDHLTKMLASKRQSEDDGVDRRSTATFDDVYDSTYRRSTATFDYDYSSPTGRMSTNARDGTGVATEMTPAILEGSDGDDDDDSESSSSSVGSSEWSSDDGFSSVDATSLTASETDVSDTAPVLAAIGEASASNSQMTSSHHVSNPTIIPNDSNPESHSDEVDHGINTQQETEHVTQDDLDKAIEAGDWQAVSATAALIANSYPTEPTVFDESDHSLLSKSAQNQVEEFEQLVEDGNWEAVIAAATRFETSASGDGESLSESWQSTQDESVSNSEGYRRDHEQHADLTRKSQEELIAEIKVLVADVVPDELENLDEMLNQFSGREKDLVTTLRTMQNYRDESANAGVFEEDSSVTSDD